MSQTPSIRYSVFTHAQKTLPGPTTIKYTPEGTGLVLLRLVVLATRMGTKRSDVRHGYSKMHRDIYHTISE